MASRVARSAVGAARLRPTTLSSRTLTPACSTSLSSHRAASGVPAEEPKKKAQSLIDALPGNSVVSKTAILSAGAGVSIAAISNELYVLNEESIVALSLLSVFFAVGKYGGPMYKEWADGQVSKIKNILNAARQDHTHAVQQRIESVKDLGGVIDFTKQLFEVSKETAQLEAKAYELEQRTALTHEAKSVLDSWVRYEGQVKQRQQRELAESVIAKIHKELENPRTLQQILQQSVTDVESRFQYLMPFKSCEIHFTNTTTAQALSSLKLNDG
ncbi:MAG: atp4 subunit B of the stator stalk of mitochondrial F1F0 ATP synthase [Chaenotheca gracillima]|nr:MAG: atp4 subunit B of the stator stalk of mitochondrial F1F0 ATP synthase [Chaenotheca gracillima]